MVSYHKLDHDGHMQIYVARFQEGRWRLHCITKWNKNIAFSGRGAMPFIGIRISELKTLGPDKFIIRYRHRDYGSGRIALNEETLRPVKGNARIGSEHPEELTEPTLPFKGVSVRISSDLGGPDKRETKYLLRWETLGAHHDRPRDPPLPPASPLTLVTLRRDKQ
jgi:hypothetical protein